MIPKIAFIRNVDDNNNDFEIASCSRVHGTSRLFADNQTQESVMGHNVTWLPRRKGLLRVELLKKKELDEWLYYRTYGGLNIL